ncbi:MAG: CoA protein activase [Firmicutes bacterium]|nr:CoA protein activase [Bacillota bacterium]
MKVTVPHMGNLYIAIEALIYEMGHDPIIPPPCSKKTLDLGTKYSPESVCLPMKLNIGNFLEAVELGAEVIIMAGGNGPCRLGYYAPVQMAILEELGQSVEMIVLEPPKGNLRHLISQLSRLFAKKGFRSFIKGCQIAWEKLKAVEELERAAFWVRPREKRKGEVGRQLHLALNNLRTAALLKDIKRVKNEQIAEILSLAELNIEPLKIGIVGEIYTVLEPFVNLKLEERLGNLGVEVERTIWLEDWVKKHLFLASLNLYNGSDLVKKTEGYLRGFVGGHGLESVAVTIMFAEKNIDGVIHILPFTCMPEIVAQSVLPNVSRDYDLPVMSLVVDEHTGEAGFQTRLEAFVDLLERKQREKTNEKKSVSWC